jgi:hypothetical protein
VKSRGPVRLGGVDIGSFRDQRAHGASVGILRGLDERRAFSAERKCKVENAKYKVSSK